jgi:LysW-gamma-L-lysine carboxypeptidase
LILEIDFLESLLKIYSPSHQEQAAVEYLVAALQRMGYQAFIDPAGNAVGKRGSGPHEIMLLGHIDTVSGFIDVHREGDLLYGRGAVDAKGPLACFVVAGACLEPPPRWRLTVIGAVGEESESQGATYVRDQYRPQMLVIGEPSKWERITLGFKGSLWAHYRIHQRMAHTASASESASEIAVKFWNQVQAWCGSVNAPDATIFSQLTPSLRGMNSSNNGFEETASLQINFRLPPGIPSEAVVARLQKMQGPGELSFRDGVPAYKAEKNTPLVRAFLTAIRGAGGKPVFSLKTGTSDMNSVAPLWGCPTVAYGPGDSSLDHTPHEHVSIAEYQKSISILTEVLEQVFGLP